MNYDDIYGDLVIKMNEDKYEATKSDPDIRKALIILKFLSNFKEKD